jgi:hypothetical protein
MAATYLFRLLPLTKSAVVAFTMAGKKEGTPLQVGHESRNPLIRLKEFVADIF